jgi:SAM-dependent methyltransferase
MQDTPIEGKADNLQTTGSALPNRLMVGLTLLSAATLTFEINLTRLFSVAQFYHFAFMIVSLALLGLGASGTLLAIFPNLGRNQPVQSFGWCSAGCGFSMLGAYLLTNWLPFDSFSIAWETKQVGILMLHYAALALPYFFAGVATSLLLALDPQSAAGTYAVNLAGSALGCIFALVFPIFLGGVGTVTASGMLAVLAALATLPWQRAREVQSRQTSFSRLEYWVFPIMCATLLLFTGLDVARRTVGKTPLRLLDLYISPYKGLSYALQYPGAQVLSEKWNSFSRVDLVRSQGIRSLPGLSYRYLQAPPAEDGIFVDGDDLSPVILPGASMDFTGYLPAAVAFQLHSRAEVLVLEPRGGLDVITSLAGGAQQVTVIEANPLIVEAARRIYELPKVHLVVESERSYMRNTKASFDVVLLSLQSSYHPVNSGAYSLSEDYGYTVEAFQDALGMLKPGGVLVVTRWLQTPPSESLRTFALAVTALDRSGRDPANRIVVYRGYNTATTLVKNDPFTVTELQTVRKFAASQALDLVYAPGIRPDETNQFNVLPEPLYYQAYNALIKATPRQVFYASYPFDVSPPNDDRPFFGHFFKWSQARQVWAEMGKTWQPFGGAGYFVILALLLLAIVFATGLVLLPALFRGGQKSMSSKLSPSRPFTRSYLLYFAAIGFGYLLVEIPLIQRFILYLGQPAYAMTAVLFTLLLFSGLGSWWSARIPSSYALVILSVLLLAYPWLLPIFFRLTLGASFTLRLFFTVICLAPAGILMGMPFPAGIRWLAASELSGRLVPWAWSVNGAASVVAAVLAALLALSFGFSRVLIVGAGCYWLACLIVATLKIKRGGKIAK